MSAAATNPGVYRPEIWIFASTVVDSAVRAEPADTGSLYGLRLDPAFPLARMVKAADKDGVTIDEIYDDVVALIGAGWRTIHLVYHFQDEGVAGSMFQKLRPLVTGDLDLQLHNWYQSSGDVLMGIGAPDFAVSVALAAAAKKRASATTLKLATEPVLPPGFRERLLVALNGWEDAARAYYSSVFVEQYGREPIDWDKVIVA